MMRGTTSTIKSLAQIRSTAHTPSVNIWEPWTIMLTGITKRNISMVSFELFLQWCSCMAVLIRWGSCKLRHSPPPPHLHTRKKIVYVCKHETICTNTAREAGGCRSRKKRTYIVGFAQACMWNAIRVRVTWFIAWAKKQVDKLVQKKMLPFVISVGVNRSRTVHPNISRALQTSLSIINHHFLQSSSLLPFDWGSVSTLMIF